METLYELTIGACFHRGRPVLVMWFFSEKLSTFLMRWNIGREMKTYPDGHNPAATYR